MPLTAVGAILAFLLVSFLWWKVVGAFVRLVLLILAGAALFVLLKQLGVL